MFSIDTLLLYLWSIQPCSGFPNSRKYFIPCNWNWSAIANQYSNNTATLLLKWDWFSYLLSYGYITFCSVLYYWFVHVVQCINENCGIGIVKSIQLINLVICVSCVLLVDLAELKNTFKLHTQYHTWARWWLRVVLWACCQWHRCCSHNYYQVIILII